MTSNSESFDGFSDETFKFFHDLGINNYKEWFEAHKPDYLRYVREPLRMFTFELGRKMRELDPEIEEIANPDKAIARINRDIRFSKDKSPYRTNLWVTFKRPTFDWKLDPEFFFEVAFDGYQFGMGFFTMTPELRESMKNLIAFNQTEFQKVDSIISNSKVFTLAGERYKRPIDKTLSEQARNWCERKSLYFFCKRDIEEVLFKRDLVDHIYRSFLEIRPVYKWLWTVKR